MLWILVRYTKDVLYFIKGKLADKQKSFIVVESGGIGFKIYVSPFVLQSLPQLGEEIKIYTWLYGRNDGMFELYGFDSERELALFEKLNSVAGIGPKTALGLLGLGRIDRLTAAINEGKADLLTKVSGIGKKTAERIVLELKGKLDFDRAKSEQELSLIEGDAELEETLISLGYTKQQAKKAISAVPSSIRGFKERLKAALKNAK